MRHCLSAGPLPFGKIDLCQADYREFICSKETFEWLSSGAMASLNDVPVSLQVMDTLVGGHNVAVKIWVDLPDAHQVMRELQAKVGA